jgi:hypothetical protein
MSAKFRVGCSAERNRYVADESDNALAQFFQCFPRGAAAGATIQSAFSIEVRMLRTLQKPAFVLAFAVSAAACGDSTAPTGVPVGNYTAIQFVTTGSSGQRDELAAGSTLTLNLASNGTTSGHLHVAASASNPVLDADMAGTWREDGNVVTVSQAADTFVKDMPFTLSNDPVNGWILVGDKSFNSVRIQLTLRATTICPAC